MAATGQDIRSKFGQTITVEYRNEPDPQVEGHGWWQQWGKAALTQHALTLLEPQLKVFRKISKNPELRYEDPVNVPEDKDVLLRRPVFKGETWSFIRVGTPVRSFEMNADGQLQWYDLQLQANCHSGNGTLWQNDIEVTYRYKPENGILSNRFSKALSFIRSSRPTLSAIASKTTSIARTLRSSTSIPTEESVALFDSSQRTVSTSSLTSRTG
jgi:hypothetical protein